MRAAATLVLLLALSGCGDDGATAARDEPRQRETATPSADAAALDSRSWARQARAVCARRLPDLRDVGAKARAAGADDTLSDREKARRIAEQFGHVERRVRTALVALKRIPRPEGDRRPAAFVAAYAWFHDLLAGAVWLLRDGDVRAGHRHLRAALDSANAVAQRGEPFGLAAACLPRIE